MAKIIKINPNMEMAGADRDSHIYVSQMDGTAYIDNESINFGSGRVPIYTERGKIISTSLERGLFAMAMSCGEILDKNNIPSNDNPDFVKDCMFIMNVIRKNNEGVKTLKICGLPKEFFIDEKHANSIIEYYKEYERVITIGEVSPEIKKLYERFLKEEGISVEEFIQNDAYIVVSMRDKMWNLLLRHEIINATCIEKVYDEE